MQIAAEHAETIGKRTGMDMEERLLLDWIALNAAGISPRHHQPSGGVEPHLAHAEGAWRNLAVVAARIAVHPLVVHRGIQVAFSRPRRERIVQCRHLESVNTLY